MSNMDAIKTNLKVWCRRMDVPVVEGDDSKAFKLAPTSVRRGPICIAVIRHVQAVHGAGVATEMLLPIGWLAAHGIISVMDNACSQSMVAQNLKGWAVDERSQEAVEKHHQLICDVVAYAIARRETEKKQQGTSVADVILDQLHKR